MHETVAVGDRVGLVENLDGFAIVKLPAAAVEESVAGPARRGHRAWLRGRGVHSILHILVSDHRGSICWPNARAPMSIATSTIRQAWMRVIGYLPSFTRRPHLLIPTVFYITAARRVLGRGTKKKLLRPKYCSIDKATRSAYSSFGIVFHVPQKA